MPSSNRGIVALAFAFALAACDVTPDPVVLPPPPPPPEPVAGIALTDVSVHGWDLPDIASTEPTGWGSADMYSGGVAFTDVDGDDLPDLVLARTGEGDLALQGLVLLRGNGDGSFVDVTAVAGLDDDGPTVGVAVADFDGDGRVDLFVPTEADGDRLYLQTAPLHFEEVGAAAGVRGDERRSRSVALLDYDADGWIDIYVTEWDGAGPGGHHGGQGRWIAPNVLYRNLGDGTFQDVTKEAGVDCFGRSTLGTAAGDLDGDGDLDLYVANDFFDDCLYENLGDGTFVEIALAAGAGPHAINGMGVALGDANDDGLPEILVTDDLRPDASTGNAFYWNLGGMRFESAAMEVDLDGGESVDQNSGVYWGAGWRDFDGDGVLDLHMAQQNTGPDRVYTWVEDEGAYRAVPAERFTSSADARGSAYADYDRDGRVDLVLASRGPALYLFHNDGAAGTGFVRVRVRGPRGNRSAIGARITAVACGRTLHRDIEGGTGYLSSSEPAVTLGIGDCASVTSVEARLAGLPPAAMGPIPAGSDVTLELAK